MFKYNWYYYYILLKRLYSLTLYITLKKIKIMFYNACVFALFPNRVPEGTHF